MDITLNKPAPARNVIHISIKEGDYQPHIDGKLKALAHKASMPGFRPGKVPVSVIKKMHGKDLLIEKINSLVADSLGNYIKEQNLLLVGAPLPIHEISDWDTQKDFNFEFEIGLIEDFVIDLSPAVSIPQYIAAVDEQMLDRNMNELRNRHYIEEYPEVSEAGDTLTGDIEVEGQETKTIALPLKLFSPEEVKPFLGLKVKEKHRLDISQLPESKFARANILLLPVEEAETATGSFTFTVDTISRHKPAELNEKFFAAVFRDSEIKTEEAFRVRLKEQLMEESEKDSLLRLDLSIQEYFTAHTSINLPEEFLRKWIRFKNKNISEEKLEKELPKALKEVKWGVIVSKLAKEYNFKAEPEELMESAKREFWDHLGIDPDSVPDIDFTPQIEKYLKEDKSGHIASRVYQQVMHLKAIQLIREIITHDKKEVSMEEYKRIVEGHQTLYE